MIILFGLVEALTSRRSTEVMRQISFGLRDGGSHAVDCKARQPIRIYLVSWFRCCRKRWI